MKRHLILTGLLLILGTLAGCSAQKETQTVPSAQTAPTSPATAPVTTTPATSSGMRYAVVAAESSAAYHVRETFLGQNLDVTAVGKSSGFQGELILDQGVIQPSTIQVELAALQSDESRRDNQVRRALDTANHPYAIFQVTGAEGDPVLPEGQEVAVKLQGSLTIKGATQPTTFDAKVKLTGDTLSISASTTFPMTQFGVKPPNIAGFVSVVDEVTLQIAFTGKR